MRDIELVSERAVMDMARAVRDMARAALVLRNTGGLHIYHDTLHHINDIADELGMDNDALWRAAQESTRCGSLKSTRS